MFRAALFGSLFTGSYSYYNQQQQQQQNLNNFFNFAWCKKVNPPFDMQKLGDDLFQMLEQNPDMAPTLVRLAWHGAGNYSKNDHKNEGSPNTASMRFEPECKFGANAGLGIAREFLEPLKKKYPNISYADLWTLSSIIAIQQMSGPQIPWRWGRKDANEGCTKDGRLPDAMKGADHVRDVFGRMGFNDREMVAIIGGGHAIGQCHANASGFIGKWKHDHLIFDNGFFTALFGEEWKLDTTKPQKQYTDKNTGILMMLPSDMVFASDEKFKKVAKEYEADNDLFLKDFASAYQKLLEFGYAEGQLNECDGYTPRD